MSTDATKSDAPVEKGNRWLMTIPAFVTHMCIGTPYAWSVMSATIAMEHGFVSSAARCAAVPLFESVSQPRRFCAVPAAIGRFRK